MHPSEFHAASAVNDNPTKLFIMQLRGPSETGRPPKNREKNSRKHWESYAGEAKALGKLWGGAEHTHIQTHSEAKGKKKSPQSSSRRGNLITGGTSTPRHFSLSGVKVLCFSTGIVLIYVHLHNALGGRRRRK